MHFKKIYPDSSDFTKLPGILDQTFNQLDPDHALHNTTITVGDIWTKKSKLNFLTDFTTTSLRKDDQNNEKDKAFDLLDALTRSGALDINDGEIHIVLSVNHCFDKTLIDTVIQDNINPIEKIERSMLIINSTLRELKSEELIQPEHLNRIKKSSPQLFN